LIFLSFCIGIALLVLFIPMDSATSPLPDWLFQVSPESRFNAIIIGWVSRPLDCVKRLCLGGRVAGHGGGVEQQDDASDQ
jgi:hypothetical protein